MADMTTVTGAPTSGAGSAKAETKDCSTRDLLKQIQDAVIAARLEQQLTSQKVTALEAHLKQLQDYDTKITAAADAYKQGIDAVGAGFADLRKAVEQAKSSYECLVKSDAKTKIGQVLADLRNRRKSLETCGWNLQRAVIDKKCELDRANAEVDKANRELDAMLALLATRSKELDALKTLKETISGCSDTSTNECRYAFFLDLQDRLSAECISVEDYRCDLVESVTALDEARQKARDVEGQARVAQDHLDRVTKLHDDLVAGWSDQLCDAVTAGSVSPLPQEIADACAACDGSAAAPAVTTGEERGRDERDLGDRRSGE
jgi:hypothetical protein